MPQCECGTGRIQGARRNRFDVRRIAQAGGPGKKLDRIALAGAQCDCFDDLGPRQCGAADVGSVLSAAKLALPGAKAVHPARHRIDVTAQRIDTEARIPAVVA
jgi:hypothetical protein